MPAVDEALEGSGIRTEWLKQYGGSLAEVGGELETLEEGLAEVGLVPTIFEADKMPLHNVSYVTPFTTDDPGLILSVMDGSRRSVHAPPPAFTAKVGSATTVDTDAEREKAVRIKQCLFSGTAEQDLPAWFQKRESTA